MEEEYRYDIKVHYKDKSLGLMEYKNVLIDNEVADEYGDFLYFFGDDSVSVMINKKSVNFIIVTKI